MGLIGRIDWFTKKMYRTKGSKDPFIWVASLYYTSQLQQLTQI